MIYNADNEQIYNDKPKLDSDTYFLLFSFILGGVDKVWTRCGQYETPCK